MITNDMRIGGLASGMDTDSIIESLVKAHRMPIDKLKQNKQILQWQQEDYREINTKLRTFRDKVFSMKLQSTYLSKKATSSNEDAVGVTVSSSALQGSYAVTVTNLAAGVTKGSQAALADEKDTDGTTKTLSGQFGLSGNITFKLAGSNGEKEFTFDTTTATINTVVSEINNADLGIKASYDSTLDRFFLATKSTGSTEKIHVINDANNFLSDATGAGTNTLKLKLTTGTASNGQDAMFDFGDATGLTSATNSVTVNGVNLNLKTGGGATSTITVTSDTDAVFNSIKDFVTAYNDTIASINEKLNETRHRDYLPLTDEQKDAMSEKDIEKWEEFARSGLLRGDSLLSGVVTKMRGTMSTTVPGLDTGSKYNTLSAIGIKTGLYSEKGKLYIDEAKLKEALQKDADGVIRLFTKDDAEYDNKGLALRLYDDVNNGMKNISSKAGSADGFSLVDNSVIGKQLKGIDKQVDEMEERLQKIEDRYWRQFSAMEKAISRMNSQSAWLAQQFGGGM